MGDHRHYDRSTIVPQICALVETGMFFSRACEKIGIPESTARTWEAEDEDIAAKYARARLAGFDAMAIAAVDIADNLDEDANSRRVRVDARKWLLSKWRPEKYGDKVQNEHSGAVTVTVATGVPDAKDD